MPSGAERDREDVALLWCLEKLLSSSKVESDPLMSFMANLSWNSLLCGDCPISFKCRIFLHRLKRQQSLTMETVESLETLASLVGSWSKGDTADAPPPQTDILMPDPQFIEDVKTAIVLQEWAGHPNDSVGEGRKRVLDVFGTSKIVQPSRYDDCLRAARDLNYREKIKNEIQPIEVLKSVGAFVDSCLEVLGMPVIDAVLEDASSGHYNPHNSGGRRISNLLYIGSHQQGSPHHGNGDRKVTTNDDVVNNNDHGQLMDVIGMANGIIAQTRDATINEHDDTFLHALGTAKEFLANPGASTSCDPQSVENVLLMLQKGFSTPSGNTSDEKETPKASKQRTNIAGVKRRPNRWWSNEEVAVLKAGLFKYGPGSWAKILREHGDILCNRTQVDLKDKWRNMRRNKEDADVQAILDRSLK